MVSVIIEGRPDKLRSCRFCTGYTRKHDDEGHSFLPWLALRWSIRLVFTNAFISELSFVSSKTEIIIFWSLCLEFQNIRTEAARILKSGLFGVRAWSWRSIQNPDVSGFKANRRLTDEFLSDSRDKHLKRRREPWSAELKTVGRTCQGKARPLLEGYVWGKCRIFKVIGQDIIVLFPKSWIAVRRFWKGSDDAEYERSLLGDCCQAWGKLHSERTAINVLSYISETLWIDVFRLGIPIQDINQTGR